MVNLYFDESGSIDNKNPYMKHFVIAIVYAKDKEKLLRAYKRFVSSNHKRLLELDEEKTSLSGQVRKPGGKMFKDGKFHELKGSQFDPDMKRRFVEFFSDREELELFFIRFDNDRLDDHLCENTARAFNYSVRLALSWFIKNGLLPKDCYYLQLDERNEKPDARYFLANYLNTELIMNGTVTEPFQVKYFDSAANRIIQLADVFANLYYSQMLSNAYSKEMRLLEDKGVLRKIFVFPLRS